MLPRAFLALLVSAATSLSLSRPAPAAELPTADGYRGIWYMNSPTKNQYVYKYAGGYATYPQQHAPIAIYAKAVPVDQMSIGIARVKLGRALVRQSRWKEAEPELVAGYEIVNKQAPTSEWATSARDDLVAAYKAMGRPDDARSIELRRPR